MFFLVIALGKQRLTVLAGWMTMIMAFTTCTVPGFLFLLGDWGHVPAWAQAIVIVATALALLPVARSTLRPDAVPLVPLQRERVPVHTA